MMYAPYSERYHVSPPNILSGFLAVGRDKLINAASSYQTFFDQFIQVNYLSCRAVLLLYNFLALNTVIHKPRIHSDS